ncbi:putative ABC transport system permease protein [Barrientosiimonas humi]|uniref:Putative ABC transport system permease protein n=1 Tax=Barrientosiimonas humi TaxID=999931 RepID=A0A542XEV1_9MICO|nr:ABC transporter permease [Barrientosiimonas humi]TQL34353.1 putative ABC transport system permease protein [Barrientosiimonas humi]
MLRATWKSLWSRKIRLLLSTFAIVLGVAFVAGSLVFTATLDRAFQSIMTGSVSDVVVRPVGSSGDDGAAPGRGIPASTLERVRAVPGVERVEPEVTSFSTYVVGSDGKLVGGQGAPGIATTYHDAPAAHGIPGLRMSEGRAPTNSTEVAIDPRTAERAGYRVGDKVDLVTAGKQPRVRATLVGLVSFADGSGLAGASLVAWDLRTGQSLYQTQPGTYSDLWVVIDQDRTQQEVRDAVAKVLPAGVEAQTGDRAADEASSDIKEALSFITTFLLIFAGVALVVGSFLIINTFSILVAQRARELALLRALGASRRQVTWSVLFEAVVVGLVGSTLGLALGLLLAAGIKVLFAQFGLDLSGTPLQLTPTAVVAAYAVGMVVTGLAAYLPARRAAQVAPVAALRDEVAMPEGIVLRRALLGGLLVLLGVGLELWVLTGERAQETTLLGAGLFLVVAGAVLASPVVGRPIIRGLGSAFRRVFGTVGNLAEQNALRQPRRTAATASALMIGLALVSMMSVFGASATKSVDTLIEENFQGDYTVSGNFGMPFSSTVADGLERVPGVDAVARVRFAPAQIDGKARQALGGTDLVALQRITMIEPVSGSLDGLDAASAVVNESKAEELGVQPGDDIRVALAGRTTTLRVAAVVKDNPAVAPVVTTLAGFQRAGGPDQDNYVFVDRAAGSDPAAVRAGLERQVEALPTVTLKDQDEFKAEQREPIDQLLMLIYALLGLAVIIAILGIVNTLALSVIERTREIGLLRAVGLSRRQLRRMVRLESVTIAVVGALLGVALGIGFGVVLQRSQESQGIAQLAIPWGRLGLFVVLAAVVGVLAAWFPARRAARLDVLKAIATE